MDDTLLIAFLAEGCAVESPHFSLDDCREVSQNILNEMRGKGYTVAFNLINESIEISKPGGESNASYEMFAKTLIDAVRRKNKQLKRRR